MECVSYGPPTFTYGPPHVKCLHVLYESYGPPYLIWNGYHGPPQVHLVPHTLYGMCIIWSPHIYIWSLHM